MEEGRSRGEHVADGKLRDEDISTTWRQTAGSGAGLTADPDGTDGDSTDGTDGDSGDSDGQDS
jgi:hypothetical protein